jgi:hypothetical protein
MVDPGKRTQLQHLAEIIRVWQLKHDNETVKKMLAHPAFQSAQKVVTAQPRKDGKGDWVM